MVTRVVFGVTVPMTAQAFLVDQLADLVSRGWDVHLVTSPDEGFSELTAIPGITVHAIPMRRDPSPIGDARSLAAWKKLLSLLKPDIAVASTPKAALLGMRAARACRVPVRVYHVRGLRLEGLSGMRKHLGRLAERITVRSATDVVCDSTSLREAMRAAGILHRDQGTVLGHGSCCGVDIVRFRQPSAEERAGARARLTCLPDATVVGFVGRITEDKGIADLIRAVQQVRTDKPNVSLALVGPTEAGADLRTMIEIGRTEGWLLTPGALSDPREAYWAFDIFCLPSLREGFPIAPLEAQACGLPVITTTATGCRDSIQDDVTGLLIAPSSVTSLAAAIHRLAADAELRARLGSAGVDFVGQHFRREDVRTRFINYLLSRKSR